MNRTPDTPGQPVELPTRPRLMARIRNYFFTGLVTAAPIAITLWIVVGLVRWVDSLVKPLIPARYDPDLLLLFDIPGVGVVIAFTLITLLGFLTANLLGRSLVSFGERIVGRMPFIRSIYGALKQIFETVLASSTPTFNQVVLIEFPRREVWSIAFVATSARGEVREVLQSGIEPEEEMISVFVPTTPNPTSGYLLFARRSECILLDMTVEDGAKMVISAGLVTPEYHKRTKALADAARAKPRPRAAE
jgi:uncharacterized membrane protein